jgi:hypothetical protein
MSMSKHVGPIIIREPPLGGWWMVPVGTQWVVGKLNTAEWPGDPETREAMERLGKKAPGPQHLSPVYSLRLVEGRGPGGEPLLRREVYPILHYPEIDRYDLPQNWTGISVERLDPESRQDLAAMIDNCAANVMRVRSRLVQP